MQRLRKWETTLPMSKLRSKWSSDPSAHINSKMWCISSLPVAPASSYHLWTQTWPWSGSDLTSIPIGARCFVRILGKPPEHCDENPDDSWQSPSLRSKLSMQGKQSKATSQVCLGCLGRSSPNFLPQLGDVTGPTCPKNWGCWSSWNASVTEATLTSTEAKGPSRLRKVLLFPCFQHPNFPFDSWGNTIHSWLFVSRHHTT